MVTKIFEPIFLCLSGAHCQCSGQEHKNKEEEQEQGKEQEQGHALQKNKHAEDNQKNKQKNKHAEDNQKNKWGKRTRTGAKEQGHALNWTCERLPVASIGLSA